MYKMNVVNYLLLCKGNSDQGGPEFSVRGFTKLKSAQRAMAESYQIIAAALDIPVGTKPFKNAYTTQSGNSVHLSRHGDSFHWEIIQAIPEDGVSDISYPSSSALLQVMGDRHIPLVEALLELRHEEPEMLEGLIEVFPSNDKDLDIFEVRLIRPPYLRALNDISQLLQNNGYEDASKFLDCSFEL